MTESPNRMTRLPLAFAPTCCWRASVVVGPLEPAGGGLRWGERDLLGLPPWERGITTVFQEHNLFDHLPVWANIGLGLAAVLGHIFPIWAEFRGGKGVATLLGLVMGISPLSALSCLGVFLLVLYLTRFVSLSSILASLAFPVFILVIYNVLAKWQQQPAARNYLLAVSAGSHRFLEEQLRSYESKLLEAERRLTDFKVRHFGATGVAKEDYFLRMSVMQEGLGKLRGELRNHRASTPIPDSSTQLAAPLHCAARPEVA